MGQTELSIARTYYTITPILERSGLVKFQIDGLSLFEKTNQRSLDRAAKFLEERLVGAASRSFTIH